LLYLNRNPRPLAEIYLSRARVVGSVFAAALTVLKVVMPPAVAVQNIDGDILEAIARITPSQPNEAMARIAPRINGTISLDQSCRVKVPEQGSLDQIRNCSRRSK
jgi:hypothetical protein